MLVNRYNSNDIISLFILVSVWRFFIILYFRQDPKVIRCEKSWQEQRDIFYLSIEALKDHTVVTDIQKEMSNLTPNQPNLQGRLVSSR